MTTAAAVPPGSARRRVRVDVLRLAECLLGLAAVGLAAATFGAFYDGWPWLGWLVGAAVVGGGLVGLGLLGRWRWWTVTVVVALVLVLLAHAAGYGSLSWFGLPTPASLRAFGSGLATGLPKMLAVGLPADFDDDLVVLPVLVVGAAGAVTVAMLLRTRWITPVVLPALVVLVLGLALTAARGGDRLVLTGAFVLVVLGLLVLRGNRVSVAEGEGISESDADAVGLDLPARRRRSTHGRVVLGLPVVAVVTAAALAGAWFLPIARGDQRVDPRSLYHAQFRIHDVLSPLSLLRPQLVGADEELFTVRVRGDDPTVPLDRVRVAALDRFDGGLWSRSATFRLTGTTLPDPEPLPAGATRLRLDVRIQHLPQPFLPVAGEPVRFGGGDFGFDRATDTVVSTRRDVAGVGYATTAVLRVLDDSARQVEPSRTRQDRDYAELPGAPPWVATLLQQVTAQRPTTLGRLLAIESYLQAQPFRRDAPSGNSYGAVYRALLGTEPRVGSAEQYAAAFAILARAAGIPARVAVGYRLRPSERDGDLYRVHSGDAHAWPEVHLRGYGWVPFEPTDVGGELSALPSRAPDLTLSSTDSDGSPATGGGPAAGATGPDAPSVAARVVSVAAPVAGGVVLVLLLVVLAKSLRRLRRAHHGPPARRVVGAWRQVVDRLTEAGVRVPLSHTGGEVARDLLGGPAAPVSRHVAELAPLVAGAVFAFEEPDDADADRAWVLERRIRRELASALPIVVRIRGAVDPRPLLPRLVRLRRGGRRPAPASGRARTGVDR